MYAEDLHYDPFQPPHICEWTEHFLCYSLPEILLVSDQQSHIKSQLKILNVTKNELFMAIVHIA